LANTGVRFDASSLGDVLTGPESLGILLGLFLGKQIGILTATWLCVRSGLSVLPIGTTFRHIYGGATLCGIGFTMSLFIADLSFTSADMHDKAKIGIMLGSLLSAAVGMMILSLRRAPSDDVATQDVAANPERDKISLVASTTQGDTDMLNPIVLLVDDEEAFVKAMEKRLSARNFDVLTALSGEEALRKLDQELLIDVVVLDLKMPGMDGLETLRQIKDLHPLVEVIILTGFGTIDTAVRGTREGAFDYLTKPCDLVELIDKVEQAQKLKRRHQHDYIVETGRELRRQRGV